MNNGETLPFEEVGEEGAELASSDDRFVAIKAALTLAEINMVSGQPTDAETLIETTLQIHNFLTINAKSNE